MVRNPLRNITFGQVISIVVFGLVFLQIVSKILGNWWSSWDLRLGFAFQLMVVGLAVILFFMVIVRKKAELQKKDFLTLLVLTGILLAFTLLLPRFLPEIFSLFPTGENQIMSLIGG